MDTPQFYGKTWEDLTIYVKELQQTISSLNYDRMSIGQFCSSITTERDDNE